MCESWYGTAPQGPSACCWTKAYRPLQRQPGDRRGAGGEPGETGSSTSAAGTATLVRGRPPGRGPGLRDRPQRRGHLLRLPQRRAARPGRSRTDFRCGSLFEPLEGISADVVIGDVSGIPDDLAHLSDWFPGGFAGGPTGASCRWRCCRPPVSTSGRAELYLTTGTIQDENAVLKAARSIFEGRIRNLRERLFPLPGKIVETAVCGAWPTRVWWTSSGAAAGSCGGSASGSAPPRPPDRRDPRTREPPAATSRKGIPRRPVAVAPGQRRLRDHRPDHRADARADADLSGRAVRHAARVDPVRARAGVAGAVPERGGRGNHIRRSACRRRRSARTCCSGWRSRPWSGSVGIVLYLRSVQLGLNRCVIPVPPLGHWWTIPILVLGAIQAGLLEMVDIVIPDPQAPAAVAHGRGRRRYQRASCVARTTSTRAGADSWGTCCWASLFGTIFLRWRQDLAADRRPHAAGPGRGARVHRRSGRICPAAEQPGRRSRFP